MMPKGFVGIEFGEELAEGLAGILVIALANWVLHINWVIILDKYKIFYLQGNDSEIWE